MEVDGVYVEELWRYPVKSLRGERLECAVLSADGVAGDRLLHVRERGHVVTGRTRHGLLTIPAVTTSDGDVLVDGHPWDSGAAAEVVRAAVGPSADIVRYEGPERFDVLNLLVATDGGITAL